MITLEQLRNLSVEQRLGKRIAQIRLVREISQKQLAEMCGISNATLNKIEQGKTDCRLSIIHKIEHALECTLLLVQNEDLI